MKLEPHPYPVISGHKGKSSSGGGISEAPDDLRSTEYARVLDLLCEGEIEGLSTGDGQSVFLDGVPLQNPDGSYNFKGVTFDFRHGTQAQTHIEGFPDVESEVIVQTEVKFGTPIVRTITNQVDSARVRISVPALFQTSEKGEISGSEVQVAIDLQSAGGGFNQVVIDTIKGKTNAKYERAYKIPLTGTGPWDLRVRRITPDNGSATLQNATSFEAYTEITHVKLRYPNSVLSALRIDASQFSSIPQRSWKAKLLKVQVPTNYNPITRAYTGIWDGTFKVAWTDNPAWCFYDIVTQDRYGLGDHIKAVQIDKWSLYTIARYCDEYVRKGLPDETIYASLTAGSGADNLYFQPDGNLILRNGTAGVISVCGNIAYGADARFYFQADGNLVIVNGAGVPLWSTSSTQPQIEGTQLSFSTGTEVIAPGQVLTVGRKTLRVTNGQLVEIATPIEPRFTCNLYIQSRQDAFVVLSNMASMFRSMIYWGAGTVITSQDAPSSPVQLYTPANVTDGLFTYRGASAKTQYTVAVVSWNDPANHYRQRVEYVEDQEAVAKFGVIEAQVNAFGCTSQGQAQRFGRWVLYTSIMESELVDFSTSIEAALTRPGQICKIADPTRSGAKIGGRIVAGSSTSVTLDAPVTLAPGATYTLSIHVEGGEVVERTVSNTDGVATVLNLTTALPAAPPANAVWVLSTPNLVPQTFRIVSIAESKGVYTMTGVAYNASKYAFIEDGTALQKPAISILTTRPEPPARVTVVELPYQFGTTSAATVVISCSSVKNVLEYQFTYSVDGDSPTTVSSATPSIDVRGAKPGVWSVDVVVVGSNGLKSVAAVGTGLVTNAENQQVSNSNLVPNGEFDAGTRSIYINEKSLTANVPNPVVLDVPGVGYALQMPDGGSGQFYSYSLGTMAVQPGRVYRISLSAARTSGSGPVVGFGLRIAYKTTLYAEPITTANRQGFTDLIAGATPALSNTYSPLEFEWTCPPNVKWAAVQLYNTADAVMGFSVANVFFAPKARMDQEVVDGPTYGRVVQAALTVNQPDFSKIGIINRSADYVSESADRKWAGESGADVSGTNTTSFPLNPGFEAGDKYWVKGAGWEISATTNSRRGSGWSAAFFGTSASLSTSRVVAVAPGDVMRFSAWFKRINVNAESNAQVRVNFFDATGNLLSTQPSLGLTTANTTNNVYAFDKVIAKAPPSTAFAQADITVTGRTAGLWFVDDTEGALLPASQDEVPDGISFPRVGGQPVDSIKHVGTVTTNGSNAYSYRRIWTGNYTIVAGDKLTYETFADATNPDFQSGIDFKLSSGQVFRDTNVKDQHGLGFGNVSQGIGRWARRVFDLSSLAGTQITSAATALEGDIAGTYIARFANVVIVNGSTIKAAFFTDAAKTPVVDAPIWYEGANEVGYTNVRLTAVDQDTQDGLLDGAIYGRTNNDILTGNRVDLSKAVINKSADFISESAIRKWAAETGATVGAIWSSNLAGKPNNLNNLVLKSSFEDGLRGTWSTGTVVSISGQAVTKALRAINRDQLELGQVFDVVPGETYFASAFIDTTGSTAYAAFGIAFYNAAGQVVSVNLPAVRNPGQPFGQAGGATVAPSSAVKGVPYAHIDVPFGPDSSQVVLFYGFYLSRYETGAERTTGKPIDILTDGVVYGRTNNDILTTNRVDLAKPVPNRSADYITESAFRKWAAETGADISRNNVSSFLQNPSFEAGDKGWARGPGWEIVSNGQPRTGTWCAQFTGPLPASITNAQASPCNAADVIAFSAWLKSTADANGFGCVRIVFYDAAGALISVANGNSITPGTSYRQSRIYAIAPANAASVNIDSAVFDRSAGTWFLDDAQGTFLARSQDEVPDGFVFGRTNNDILTNNRIDLAKPVVNRNADYITEKSLRRWAAETGATVGADWTTNLKDRPQNLNNLVGQSTFEDGTRGRWTNGSVVSISGQAVTKALRVINRDQTESGHDFDVVPGETYFVSATIDTVASSAAALFGIVFYGPGNVPVQFNLPAVQTAGQPFSQVFGTAVAPPSAVRGAPYALLGVPGGPDSDQVALFHSLYISRYESGSEKTTGKPIDILTDGSVFGRTRNDILTGNRVDLSKPVVNRSADYITESLNRRWAAETGATIGARLGNNFYSGGTLVSNLDQFPDGGIYRRALANGNNENILRNGVPNVGTPGSPAPGWISAATLVNGSDPDGQPALLISSGPISNFTATRSEDFAFAPGETYLINGYYKTGGTGYWAMYYFEDGSNTNTFMPGGAHPTVWTPFSFTYTIPAGRFAGRLTIANTSNDADTLLLCRVGVRKVRSLDSEVSDGSIYGRPLQARLDAGYPWIDLSEGRNLNRNADFITESSFRRWAGETGATVGARLGNNFYNGGTLVSNLDQFPDGSSYARTRFDQLQAGRVRIPGQGKNLLSNGGFELNTLGAYVDYKQVGDILADGWDAASVDPAWRMGRLADTGQLSGSACMYFSPQANKSIPAGAYSVVSAHCDKIPVTVGDKIVVSGRFRHDQNIAVPAGLTVNSRIDLYGLDSAGNIVFGVVLAERGESNGAGIDGLYYLLSGSYTIDSAVGATAYIRVTLTGYVRNTTGGPISTPNGLMCDMRIDEMSAAVSSNLDREVHDGSIFGRTTNDILTGNRVDLSKPVVNRSADYISESGLRRWAAETGATVGARLGNNFYNGGTLVSNLDQFPDGGTYGRTLQARLDFGYPWIDFSEGRNLNRNADYITETGGRRWAAETGATIGARWGVNLLNQPQSSENLLNKGSFVDQYLGLWTGLSLTAVSDPNHWGGALVAQARDNAEGSTFAVIPGERLFVQAKIYNATSPTHYNAAFGLVIFDKNGTAIQFPMPCVQANRNVWETKSGYLDVPAGAVKAAGFALVDGPGGQIIGPVYYADLIVTRHELGAEQTSGKPIDILTDGVLYGRTYNDILTGNRVDLSKPVVNRSADYITESLYRKWAAESGADVSSVNVDLVLQNPSFEAGDKGWSKQAGWEITNVGSPRTGAWCAQFSGNAAAAIVNDQHAPCAAGDVITISAWLKSTNNANGNASARLFFRDASGAIIGGENATSIAPTTVYQQSRGVFQVPANAVSLYVDVAVFGRTTGVWFLDDVQCIFLARSQDEVPDGAYYGRTNNDILTNNRVDLAKPVPNRSADYITESAYRRWAAESGATVGARLGNNFYNGGTLVSNLDQFPDGSSYARTRFDQLQGGRVRIPGYGKSVISNGGFELNSVGGAFGYRSIGQPVADGWDVAAATDTWMFGRFENSAPRAGSACLYFSPQPNKSIPSGVYSTAAVHSDKIPVTVGDTIVCNAWVRWDQNIAMPAGLQVNTRLDLYGFDSAGNSTFGAVLSERGESTNTGIDGVYRQIPGSYTVTGAVGTTAYVRLTVVAYVHNVTGGAISTPNGLMCNMRIDDITASVSVDLDREVYDGFVYGRTNNDILTSNRVDLAKPVPNRSADYISESAGRRWAAETGANITQNHTSLDTSNVGGRVSGTVRDESRTGYNLTQSGSGQRLGDQRNIPAITIANLRSLWTGLTISYSSVANSGQATVSVSAAQLRAGSSTISYSASSLTITAAPGTLGTYFLFYIDSTYAGGSRTLYASDYFPDIFASDDRVFIGMIDVLFAVAGGGNTGGSGSAGGGGGNYQEP